jgi:SAM-dependent methyltransferase
MTDGTDGGGDPRELIRWAYRGVLRREAGEDEVEACLAKLTPDRGGAVEILRALIESDEYRRLGEELPYSLQDDGRIARYRTPEVVELSRRLQQERPVSRAGFDAAWKERFEVELGEGPDQDLHREYGRDHAERFWEAANALAILVGDRTRPRVLEIGISVLTALYRRLFPSCELVTSERPLPDGLREFFRRQSQAAGASAHFTNDLNDPGFLTDEQRRAMGTFDLVLLTEVLEHLTVHPVDVLRQVLQLLSPGGYLYLTTPNFFSRHHLNEIAERMNPQHVFPRGGNAETAYHFRELCMSELLEFVGEAGGEVAGFYFSDCWEDRELAAELERSPDQRSNLVLVARRPTNEVSGR